MEKLRIVVESNYICKVLEARTIPYLHDAKAVG